MKKALLITTVSGFVPQFEMGNVQLLQNMGYEVHYATNYLNPSYGTDNKRLDGTGIVRHQVDFVRSPFKILKNIKAYRQLVKVMQEEPYGMIHCHTPMGAILGRLAARKLEAKVFYTAHGFHFYKGAPLINWLLYYPVERFMFRYTDVLLTITKEDYNRAHNFKANKEQKIYYVPGVGVNVEKFENVVFEKNSNPNQFVMISVGEINKNKNHRIIIEAIHKMNNPNILYLICGKGPLQEKLALLVQEYGLDKQVKFKGYCNNIEDELKKADLFVFPSLREGLSVALQEAMAAGLPAIVSNIRGNRELIDEGKGGWRVDPQNVQQWEKCILEAMNSEISEKGRYNQKKIKEYSADKVKVIMKKIYQENLLSGEQKET